MFTVMMTIKSKPEFRDQVLEECNNLLIPTQHEQGCINYYVHEDLSDPNILVFHEVWHSIELWKQHMRSAHIERFHDKTKGMIVNSQIFELNKLI